MADDVTIFTGGDHRVVVTIIPFRTSRPAAEAIGGHATTRGRVTIKNDVWIGLGTTILSDTTIGNEAVIGAEAVVTANVNDYEITVGKPRTCSAS